MKKTDNDIIIDDTIEKTLEPSKRVNLDLPLSLDGKLSVPEITNPEYDKHIRYKTKIIEDAIERERSKHPVRIDHRTIVMVSDNVSDEEAITKYHKRYKS